MRIMSVPPHLTRKRDIMQGLQTDELLVLNSRSKVKGRGAPCCFSTAASSAQPQPQLLTIYYIVSEVKAHMTCYLLCSPMQKTKGSSIKYFSTFFAIFDTSYAPCQHLFIPLRKHFLTPLPVKSADVIYGRPPRRTLTNSYSCPISSRRPPSGIFSLSIHYRTCHMYLITRQSLMATTAPASLR